MARRVELVIFTLATFNIFWASVIPIPVSVAEEADKICRKFLWGDQEDRRKLHIVYWDMICRPKKEGGLDIRKAYDWVIVGITKNIWNVVCKKDSLWVKWIHGRHLGPTTIWYFVPDASCLWI